MAIALANKAMMQADCRNFAIIRAAIGEWLSGKDAPTALSPSRNAKDPICLLIHRANRGRSCASAAIANRVRFAQKAAKAPFGTIANSLGDNRACPSPFSRLGFPRQHRAAHG
jgi:hypothetical protein